jgi:N-acetylmuramoyl-L-alanine amidase
MSRWVVVKSGRWSKYRMLFILLAGLCIIAARGVDTGEKEVISYGLANKIIVVDAGHGGADPGAIRGNYQEKDITLQVSQKLAEYLSQAGALVIMLREDDRDLAPNQQGSLAERKRADLKQRVNIANQSGAHLYLSIHVNADPNPRWSGAQTFYHAGSERSKVNAVLIQEELTRILKNTKRKAKAGDYYILSRTQMPSVIVEIGFISNPREARNMLDEDYQSRIAYAIFSGIAKAQIQDYDEDIEKYPVY